MLTRRLAHLVAERGVPASSCLAVTFTRRATEELQARLSALLPPEAGVCNVHSFHSLGLAILRAHGTALGLTPDFRIADEPERAVLLAAAMGISQAKAFRLLKAVSVLKRSGAAEDAEAAEALRLLRRLSQEQSWIDFDDLIGLAVEILEKNASVAALWQKRFRYICADEFQDVDECQYRMLRLLAGSLRNICVIGDPNQAIYGFRGADAACFEQFARDFPDACTVRLGRNYRSTGTIVTAAAQLIGEGSPAEFVRPMQEPVMLYTARSERAEAEFTAAEIERLLGGHDMLAANKGKTGKNEAGGPLGFADFAVLYRTDAQAAAFREAFDRAGIPFKKSSPAPIAGQKAVQAVLAALGQPESGLRNLDLTARIALAIEHVRRETEEPDETGLAEARHWLGALAASGPAAGSETLFREQAAICTEADFYDPRAGRVSLLTMHAAKGLEFPVVFVVGLESGLVPFSWDGNEGETGPANAEERRLFYVAMTRAKDLLYLINAAQRLRCGKVHGLPVSPFLNDIAAALTTRCKLPASKERQRPQQYSLF
jgi:DNA helicase II / ATP-dependent DNA helicase PcrA